MFKYFLYIAGRFILKSVSLKSSYRFAKFISGLQFRFSPRDRKAVIENLQSILKTNSDVSAQALEVFFNFGKYLAEFFKDGFISKDYIKNNVEIGALDRIDRALKNGKGAIIVTAHIGNWELGALVMGELGYPLMAIALPHKERPVNDLFNSQRAKKGVTVVPTSVAVRKSLETLHQNKLVALVADRDFGNHGEVLPFLGKDVLIPKGAAIFSLKTGAPIIPMFLLRREEGKFDLVIEEPIFPPQIIKGEIPKDDIIVLMKKYLKVIENQIYKYPTQWLIFRRYWV